MMPSRMAGGTTQSSSSSGIFFQGDGQFQLAANSQLSSNFANSLNPLPGHSRANTDPGSNTFLNILPSSGPSIGASSLLTDANSGGGPHLQRNAINNKETYTRLPASPMSFTSNNITISGSSAMDGSSSVMQSSNQDQNSRQLQKNQDPDTIPQLHKKPRLDVKQEDVLQQQVLQQLLQSQDPNPNQNPQLHALIQQQRLRQQQIIHSMPPMQRVQLLQQQQQQLQLRQHQQQIQQQNMQPVSGIKRPYDGGVCSRRLMQYLYHQRQRPADNTIAYWRKFVGEYYSPHAKKRWCLSLYDHVGNHSLGVFPQAAMDAWQCDICGSKSGKGFEASFEVFPRLNEIKFGSGVIDELLFLELPRECRFPSGMMMLEYAKAVQESVYDQIRVVREGQLRIIFTPDLKIASWEFCARRHEELLLRRLVAPQVNQLLLVAQKCQSTISESGPNGVSKPDLQANSDMVATARRQLARSLELPSLNDLGFSKRYVRCLQIAEVVSSMKDLMEFSRQQKVGPIEGLKNFPQHITAPKIHMPEPDQLGLQNLQGQTINSQHMVGRAALALSNYQNLQTRQNSMNSMPNSQSSPFSTSSQATTPTQGGSSRNFQETPGLLQQMQSLPSQGGQALQQQMMMQLLHDMNNKNSGGAVPNHSLSMQNSSAINGPGNVFGKPPSRSSSFKSASNDESPAPAGSIGFGKKTSDLSQNNLHLSDEMVLDIAHEFTENGFFDNDLDDNMNFSWKP